MPASAAAPRRQHVRPAAAVGQPLPVALEFLAIGQPIVGGQHRLGPLHVGVAGQDHVGVGVATAHERPLQGQPAGVDLVDRLADPEPQIGGHLVVAAAGRVQLAAHVADAVDQRPLDVHVDVFQFDAEREAALLDFLADLAQGLLNLQALVGRNQPDLGQHLGVGDRALDVLRIEPAVEAHAFGELLHATVGRLVEYPAPRFLAHQRLSGLPKKPSKSLPYCWQIGQWGQGVRQRPLRSRLESIRERG